MFFSAKPDSGTSTLNATLISAAIDGDIPGYDMCLKEGGDVNVTDKDGKTPLYIGCQKQNRDFVAHVVSNPEVDVNKARSGGYAPLWVASEKGDDAIVAILLSNPRIIVDNTSTGLPTSAEAVHPHAGVTPLAIACEKKHPRVVLLLLQSGANALYRSEMGMSPLDRARAIGSEEIVKLIEEHLSLYPSGVRLMDASSASVSASASASGGGSGGASAGAGAGAETFGR